MTDRPLCFYVLYRYKPSSFPNQNDDELLEPVRGVFAACDAEISADWDSRRGQPYPDRREQLEHYLINLSLFMADRTTDRASPCRVVATEFANLHIASGVSYVVD